MCGRLASAAYGASLVHDTQDDARQDQLGGVSDHGIGLLQCFKYPIQIIDFSQQTVLLDLPVTAVFGRFDGPPAGGIVPANPAHFARFSAQSRVA
jgi:hypothetical protein